MDAREWGDLPAEEFRAALDEAPPSLHHALLRLRFRHNRPEFCKYCWPDRFALPFNQLHRDLFDMTEIPPWRDRVKPDLLDAVAAPRGFAKSTLISFATIVHAIVYDLDSYIVIMSSGQRLARSLSFDLLGQFRSKTLQDTRRLTRLYGPFDTTGGKDEWAVSVRGRAPVGVLASSFGTDIRGAKHPELGVRPTLVVIDDGEKKDRVRNADQRTIWQSVLDRDVLKLSDRARGTAFRFIGTILHPDSILARRETDAGWRFRRYQAIIKWPKGKLARDLWDRCHKIWSNLRLGSERRNAARSFYESNFEVMNRGVKLLDPGAMDIFQLYELIWSQGMSSFLQEMQNDPVDPNTQIFHSPNFPKFRVRHDELKGMYLDIRGDDPRRVYVRDLKRKFMRWDPALGNVGGDYAAIAILGMDHWGYKYVLDCWVSRKAPSKQLAMAWAMAEKWDVTRGSVESNGFQELVAEPFHRQRGERRQSRQFWRLELDSDPSFVNKEERISTLEPEIANGWLLFNEDLDSVVWQQFDHFPTGDYDDAPDAIQGASQALGSSGSVGMVG